MEFGSDERSVYLVVGQVADPRMDRLVRETAVMVVPEPDKAQGDGENSELDPAHFKILSESTGGGHLVGIAADVVGVAFDLLARADEHRVVERDGHDRFQWVHSSIAPKELATRPLVSEYAQLLLACLKEACTKTGRPVIRKEFWPHGRTMAGCLTHDVDVVRRGKLPRGIAVRDVKVALSGVARGRLRQAAKQVAAIAQTAASSQDPYWTFDRISALEGEHGYRSTYYFMAGNHHPEDSVYNLDSPSMTQLLDSLMRSGCEIGLHGSYASYADPDMLCTLKSSLERRLGEPVTGHRNHLLRFRAPDSWRAQGNAGFSYDATLGFADHEGFRGGHAFPFHPYDDTTGRSMDLLELPLAVMDVSLLKYRRLRGEQAADAVRAILEQTLAVNGLATLLWHNDTFYDPEHPGSGRLYEMALAWLSDKGAFVGTAQEIDRWWRARAAVQLRPIGGGADGWRMETPWEIDGLVLRISLPDPEAPVRVRGQAPVALRRDGSDYLLEFSRLPAGFSMNIEYS